MKLAICVKSCYWDRDRGAHNLIRESWQKDVTGADIIFFVGNGSGILLALQSDEVHVDAPDNYIGLAEKTRKICQWVLGQDYTHALFLDTGSYLIFHHLMKSDFADHEYMGYWGMTLKAFPYTASDINRGCPEVKFERAFPWASGGGYTLSRRAMQFVANTNPLVWAEDLNTGQVLGRNGILLEDRAKIGWRGKICDWIHMERNHCPDALEKRRQWFNDTREKARLICESEGCDGKSWQLKNQPTRDLSDPDDVEKILAERRRARREK